MKFSLLLVLFYSFASYAGSNFISWQFGNIKSWNKNKVKVALVTNKELEIKHKLFEKIKVKENIAVKIIYHNGEVSKVEKIKFEEKLDLDIASIDSDNK